MVATTTKAREQEADSYGTLFTFIHRNQNLEIRRETAVTIGKKTYL